jgi:probable F420-dependent oxidoreductase
MRFGITFVNVLGFGKPEGAKAIATAAEDAGFDSLWTVEHVIVPKGYQSEYPYSDTGRMPGPEHSSIPDSFIWLSFVAAVTSTIKLATGVAILPQRNVIYTAKEIATLDRLSGGRVMLGVGAGWLAEEFAALGVPFERRGERLDEYIRALRVLWADDEPTFHGEFVDFEGALCRPQPVNKAVPIIVGGHTKRAARRAGELGDGFVPGRTDPDELKELLDVMRRAADKAGRDPDAIEVTAGGAMDPAGVERYRALGVSRLLVPPLAFDVDGIRGALEKFGEDVISKVS